MVAKKITKDLLLDLYCLYRDRSLDFTIEQLAFKVGLSRNRLGELFKRINPSNLQVEYGVSNRYQLILKEYLNEKTSITNLSQKYNVNRSTLYRNFERLTNGK